MPIAIGRSTCLQRGNVKRTTQSNTTLPCTAPRKRPSRQTVSCLLWIRVGLDAGCSVAHYLIVQRQSASFLVSFLCAEWGGRRRRVFLNDSICISCAPCIYSFMVGYIPVSEPIAFHSVILSVSQTTRRGPPLSLSHSSIKSAVRSTSSSIHYLLLARRVHRRATAATTRNFKTIRVRHLTVD